MESEIKQFSKSCLNFLLAQSGEIVPRPLGHTLHPEKIKILHFDFCYIGKEEKGFEYVLILKDDFSGYAWLILAKSADADTTAKSLQSWFTTFGMVHQCVSDQGTHFKNEVIRLLRELTVAHWP